MTVTFDLTPVFTALFCFSLILFAFFLFIWCMLVLTAVHHLEQQKQFFIVFSNDNKDLSSDQHMFNINFKL